MLSYKEYEPFLGKSKPSGVWSPVVLRPASRARLPVQSIVSLGQTWMGVEILPQDGWSRYLSNRYPSKSAPTAEFAPSARCGDAQVSALQMNVGILVVVLLVWWCSAVPRLHRFHMRCGCTNASHPHPPPPGNLSKCSDAPLPAWGKC